MLPIAAPVTAPAVCFGIDGTWISSDDWGLLFCSGFGWSSINGGLLNIFVGYKDASDDKGDIVLTKLKMSCGTHWRPTRHFGSEKHGQLFGTDNKNAERRHAHQRRRSLIRGSYLQSQLSKTGRAI
jgi:hypothetical protein